MWDLWRDPVVRLPIEGWALIDAADAPHEVAFAFERRASHSG
jgi:hypothetical protein